MRVLTCFLLLLFCAAVRAQVPAADPGDALVSPDQQRAAAYFERGNAWAEKGKFDEAIADYTRAIGFDPRLAMAYNNRGLLQSGKGNTELALADYNVAIRLAPQIPAFYYNRSGAWLLKGDAERELADDDEAIRLNPRYAEPYNDRANIWRRRHDYARAVADYDLAIGLNGKSALMYRNRGLTHFFQGSFAESRADYALAIALEQDAYAAIWHYLASLRAGAADRFTLARNTATLAPKAWPAPVVRFYLGQLTAPQLLEAAAAHPDPARRNEQQCEANYYLGESALAAGHPDEARALLGKAKEICPLDFAEADAAGVELERMR